MRSVRGSRRSARLNQLPYAPLPSSLADKDNTQLATMVCNGSPIS